MSKNIDSTPMSSKREMVVAKETSLAGFKKASKKEAKAIYSNCNTSVVLQIKK